MNGAPDVRALIDRCLQAGFQFAADEAGRLRVTWPDTPEAEALLPELRRRRDAVARFFAGLPRPGGHLFRLGLDLGLLPRCRYTVREQGDPGTAQRFAQAVADLCRRCPAREAVLMAIVEPEGERVPILWRATVGPEFRRALARLVRGYHLGLGRFGLWDGDESADAPHRGRYSAPRPRQYLPRAAEPGSEQVILGRAGSKVQDGAAEARPPALNRARAESARPPAARRLQGWQGGPSDVRTTPEARRAAAVSPPRP